MSRSFSAAVLEWYYQHGRNNLPWQHPRTAYRVWVSEIMLQQTQVTTVIPYFERFMQRFPDIIQLAQAADDEVMHYWTGLGYYARARNLHKAAKTIMAQHGGEFPREFTEVQALPGIGRSTAGAILAQAFGQRHAILDGNVKRVLARYHGVEGWTGQARVQDQLWAYAEQHTPDQDLPDYTQAIMDLGSAVCIRSRPHCAECPLSPDCQALKTDRVRELPSLKPRKSIPVKTTRMLVLLNKDKHIMLEKRPPAGIWGGLWSLPEIPLESDVKSHCQQQYQFEIQAADDSDSFRHTFSHYHLDITPCLVEVKNPDQCVMEAGRILWYNTAQPDRLGLPAPVKMILNRMSEE